MTDELSSANRRAPRRRSVVKAAAATAVLAPVAATAALTVSAQRADASMANGPAFLHGVASGDPLPDGILLWTRVTPVPEAVPGSGMGPDTAVSWEVAEDDAFSRIVAQGTVTARAATDHTVKADVRGLSPASRYSYRFRVGGVVSPVGRTRTAPAAGASVPGIRFGVVSCSNWEAGYFSAYRHLAARSDLDAVLHLGDYIYEYATGDFCAGGTVVRPHQPTHEILTLADYRIRHGAHKTDADTAAMHAAHPLIAIWDDHEFANDTWSGGAENHSPDTEGDWSARKTAAKQAYFEWMPVRPATEGTVYRRLNFGRLAELHLLDLRSFRSSQSSTGSDDVDSPDRTITGRAQLDWLKSGLLASSASWQLVGTSVMISPVAFGALPVEWLGPLADMLGLPEGGLAINVDQWDGYTHDRKELIAHLKDNGIANTVFLTGDIHSAWANDLPVNAATYPQTPSIAAEFVVTSVTSDNVDDILHVPANTASTVAELAIKGANEHVKWVDMGMHGYGVLDVTSERTQMDYYVLSERIDPQATSSWARSYRTLSGTQQIERVDAPVR